ncbi:hypothetical protein MTO96_016593 [Rhipicephalus appendiculatus]
MAPQFSSQEYQDFLDACGIRRTYSPPYHPESNGAAERAVQTVKCLRKQLMHDKGNNSRPLRERLDDFLLAYRTTPNTATGKCPAELFLQRTLRTKLSLLRPSFRDDMQRKQETVKRQHDGRRSTFRLFREGDWVYVKTVRQEKVSWTEGRVVRTVSPVTYLVETQNTVRHVHVDLFALTQFFPVCRIKHRYRGPETTLDRGLGRSSGGSHHAPADASGCGHGRTSFPMTQLW